MLKSDSVAQDVASSSMKQSGMCSSCGLVPSKYRCPACAMRTCSLECSKAHKSSSGCSGKRCRTEFINMDTFGDRQLLSDCGFLEDAGRVLNYAYRSDPGRPKNASKARRRNALPRYLVHLMKVAKKGGVDLQVRMCVLSVPWIAASGIVNRTALMYWMPMM